MLVGLVWGMAIPASPFPRLALGAHIQLTAHAVMFLVAGLVILHLPIAKSGVSAKILIAGPWLTWPVMLTEMANAWWGARNTLPIAAEQAGAAGAGAWQETIVTVAHLIGKRGKAEALAVPPVRPAIHEGSTSTPAPDKKAGTSAPKAAGRSAAMIWLGGSAAAVVLGMAVFLLAFGYWKPLNNQDQQRTSPERLTIQLTRYPNHDAWETKLQQVVDFRDFGEDPKMTLQDALNYLTDRFELSFDVDRMGFMIAGIVDRDVLLERLFYSAPSTKARNR